jgi:FKBP-type peptidyl-prolyl cis-trans isomerase 2
VKLLNRQINSSMGIVSDNAGVQAGTGCRIKSGMTKFVSLIAGLQSNLIPSGSAAICLLAACAVFMGCGHSPSKAEPQTAEQPAMVHEDVVEPGDLVSADYTFRLQQSGRIFSTTKKEVAEDQTQVRTTWFRSPNAEFGPVAVIAGDTTSLPELSRSVVGMKVGQKRSVTLPPAKGFGQPDPEMILTLPAVKKIPIETLMPVKEFVNRFNKLPRKGAMVRLAPYFESEVKAVTDTHVVLEARVAGSGPVEHEFGVTTIAVQDRDVVMRLTPTVGAVFKQDGRAGRIVESNADTFKVDFNHPAAGETLLLEIEIVSVTKAETFADNKLTWIEDHDQGYARAAGEHKPMVMVLYAGWCGWSKKLLTNTINDPRIQAYWNQFVWVKINSDENKEYKEYYDQKGYPLTLIMDSGGRIIRRLDGFSDAGAFHDALEKSLAVMASRESDKTHS